MIFKKKSNGLNLKEQSMLYSFFAFLYVIAVSILMNNMEKIFVYDRSVLIPIAILLLLVLSVTIMVLFIFGKAIMLYLNGDKKEAMKLVIYNVIGLFIITFAYFALLIILNLFL